MVESEFTRVWDATTLLPKFRPPKQRHHVSMATTADLNKVNILADTWLEDLKIKPASQAKRIEEIEVTLLKNMAEYAPILPQDGTELYGQAAIVQSILQCNGDRALLQKLAREYKDDFLFPSEC